MDRAIRVCRSYEFVDIANVKHNFRPGKGNN